MKIGIIRCQERSNECAGYKCLPAVQNRTEQFAGMDDVELVGFDTCGGCDRNKATKIVARALKLKEKGAETIYLGNCLVNTCPFKDTFEKALKEEVKLPIIEKTHK